MNTAAKALTVEHEPTAIATAPLAPASETAMVLQIIDRAARDHTVDIEKMKELMAMRNAMRAEQAELDFDQAMAAAQEEMQPIRTDAENTQTKSRYATYAALDAAIRPIYTKHGFSVTFDTGEGAPDGHVRVVAKVSRAGHRERPHIDMPADGKGPRGNDVMSKTHATGSAIQYGRRYLLGMIFNIAVSKDDDGNAAGKSPETFITDEQAATLRKLIEETGTPIEKFCDWAKIEAVPFLPARHFEKALSVLGQRKGVSS